MDQDLKNVCVIGALGKMGRGISLVLLKEMALNELKKTDSIGNWSLKLIDANLSEKNDVKNYFRSQLKKIAEKNILFLRDAFKHCETLISNEEIIDAFINGAMNLVDISTEIEHAKGADLIFEAVNEDVDFKAAIFKKIKSLCPNALFFTNTSSIPIHVLNEKGGLEKRIIGFHFYNPPAIQSLMEIIPLQENDLFEFSLSLAKRLGKTAVVSEDISGFIGNGHFIRELECGFEWIDKVGKKHGSPNAVYALDFITKDLLLRPMGLIQLVDYVGIDVVKKIADSMSQFGEKAFSFPFLEEALKQGLKGGQNPDGSQRPGIFSYEKGRVKELFSFEKKKYEPLPDISFLEEKKPDLSWKSLQKHTHKQEEIRKYFADLFERTSTGAKSAKYLLEKSHSFMEELVKNHAARDIKDVSQVLKLGFYHLYSPDEVINEAGIS